MKKIIALMLAVMMVISIGVTVGAEEIKPLETGNVNDVAVEKDQKCGDNVFWKFEKGVLTISGSGRMYDYFIIQDIPWAKYQPKTTKIVIEEGITYIGDNVFCWYEAKNNKDSVRLEEVHIPSTLKGIGNCPFSYMEDVGTVYYNAKDCEFLGTSTTYAYNYFPCGKKLVIGKSVERIGANVFLRARFDQVVCEGSWKAVVVEMEGNDVLKKVKQITPDTTPAKPAVKKDRISVTVDGKEVKFDQAPVLYEGRTLVPVRAACEEMGIKVEWVEAEQKVILVKGGKQFDMRIGKREYYTNWSGYGYFDVAPQVINNRTLLPIRAIAEFYGYKVGWDEATQTVSINSK